MRAAALVHKWMDDRCPSRLLAEAVVDGRTLQEQQMILRSVQGYDDFASQELVIDILEAFPALPQPVDIGCIRKP